MAFDITTLQNGNTICGKALSGSDGKAENGVDVVFSKENAGMADEAEVTKEIAGRVGGSFVYWLSQNAQKNPTMLKICVGTDPRLSGQELKAGVLEAISLWGAEGTDAGIVTSGAMQMAATMPQFEFDGAVMITAGDMPAEMNGFRFFAAEEEPDSEDIAEILRLASKYNFIGGTYDEKKEDLMPMHAAFQRQALAQGLSQTPGYFRDMHFIVDGGNGAGGFFATDVLGKLGADVSGSYNLEPDASFPVQGTNPEDPCAIDNMKKAVKDAGADLGIIFSPDAGRLAAISADDIITADGSKAVDVIVDAVVRKAEADKNKK